MSDKPSMQLVADGIGMDITTFSRQISTLFKKELVERIPNEGDRRIYILSLTDKGRATMESINEQIFSKMKTALDSMNDFERDTVMRSMNVLDEKLQELK